MPEGLIDIRVYDYTRRALVGAIVSTSRYKGQTDRNGRVSIEVSDCEVLRVEMAEYEEQTRLIKGIDLKRVQIFLLGHKGMPYYWRGQAKVPFKPLPGVIGIAADPTEPVPKELPSERIALEHGHYEEGGIVIVGLDDPGNAERYLQALSNEKWVKYAGSVLQLSDDKAVFLTDSIMARFKKGVTETQVKKIAEQNQFTIKQFLDPDRNDYVLQYAGPATYAMLVAANELAQDEAVVWAEPDLVSTIKLDAIIPTDFLFPEQWDHKVIDLPNAWQALQDMDSARTFGHPDIFVAVLDGGIDATHPDLSGPVSNGKSKQVELFDFTYMVGDMTNVYYEDHGTCCASACVGNTNNASVVSGINEGTAGVAGNCRLIAARMAGGSDDEYARIYRWAGGLDPESIDPRFPQKLDPGADVITTSGGLFAGELIPSCMIAVFDDLVQYGRKGLGVLLFFSAGNEDTDLDAQLERPLLVYDGCFGIAASTKGPDGTETRASYSNFGSTVDWCVPSSTAVEGTVHSPPASYGAHTATNQARPSGNLASGHPDGPRVYRSNFAGTSYSTPVAAGVAALMLSANPHLKWHEVRDILRQTATKIDPINGQWISGSGGTFSKYYGYGRINAAAAVAAAGWQISPVTSALDFKDVPEGQTRVLDIHFDVQSLWAVDLSIISGPGAPFTTPDGTSVSLEGGDGTTVRNASISIKYAATTAGGTESSSVTVQHTKSMRQWTIPITANTVAA